MDFIKLKDLNLHDVVDRNYLSANLVWKSYLELPTGFIHGIPVLYIYSERDYPRTEPKTTQYYYLFQLVRETRKYELMMKGENLDETIKKGNELQKAFLRQHFDEDVYGRWHLRE
jgi:hypothetical protein